MRRRSTLSLPIRALPVALAGLLIAGCGKKDDDEPREPVTVATFNAGLAVGFVPGAESRTPIVAQALAEQTADIICLQEVWLPEQVAAVEAEAGGTFPHRFFPDPLPGDNTGTPACPDGALDNVLGCLDEKCGDACIDDVADCLLASCTFPFISTNPPECQGCAMAQVGTDPADAREVCETESEAYAYGNSFGTGILSKHPISSVEHTVFPSSVNRRGAIHAVIEVPGGPIDVFCTHLTPDFGILPYPHASGSWIREQRDQIDALRDWIDDDASTGTVVLMGDFNTGPALEGIEPDVPDNYDRLANGWDNPFVDQVGACTFCGDNPLRGEGDDHIIDHVLLKGAANTSARRILDQDVSGAESCDVAIEATPSDHYGVEVTFTPAP